MACSRRISATFKDAPRGQVLAPTFDYTHRLLDFKLAADVDVPPAPEGTARTEPTPHISAFPRDEGLLQSEVAPEMEDAEEPAYITRQPMSYPADRATRLQALTRGMRGLSLGRPIRTNADTRASTPLSGSFGSAWWRLR